MKEKLSRSKQTKILEELENYYNKDFTFSSGKILGSMCTQSHFIAKKAYLKFLETNLGDPELFPGTREMEKKLLSFFIELLNAPKSSNGLITSGGTESNITAIWIAKKLTGKNEIIVPESAHFSFEKIGSLMDIKLVYAPLNKNYVLEISELRKIISKNTAAIIGIAGSTELGTIDPVEKLSELCIEKKIFLHIDAAFGGFVIPFLKAMVNDIPDFDFKLKGVSSISIDAHKMGYSAIPLGAIILRKKEWLDKISVSTPYISINKQAGLLATRSGGPVAAAYAVSKYLGKEGYKNLIRKCMSITKYTERRVQNIGLNLIIEPTMNVLGIKLKNPSKVVKKLSDFGWKVNKMERLSAIRIVLMPQITKKIIDDFIPD
ncbi:MAG: tyrosine decarboxylase MnfA, partial [Thermoplasmatales archaeon SG8-52-3]